MKTERTFLIAPSLVRLILRERLVSKTVVEGYLGPAGERTHFIRLEPSGCNLVLQSAGPEGTSEQRTNVPSAQAEALLDVCAGKIGYRRTHIRVGPAEALLDRFEEPGNLDLLIVEFDHPAEAQAFAPPGWFGPEVTRDLSYQKARIALSGLPQPEDVEVTNASVIALVETLEAVAGARQTAVADAAAEPRAGNGGAHPEARPEPRAEPRPVFAVPERPAVPVRSAAPAAGPVQAAPAAGTVAPLPDPRFDEVLAGLTEALETAGGGAEAAEAPDEPVEARRAGSRRR